MSGQHTPGPWSASRYGASIEGPNGGMICDFVNDYDDNPNTADVALIAAAPDLYQAVENAIAAVEAGGLEDRMCCDGHHCGCRGSSNADFLLHHLRAAIAKARGEA